MPAYKLKWNSLLHLTELDFIPEAPKVLVVSDELVQSLSWLTGATSHDRRLIRCNELGAILIGNAWDNLAEVETDELYPTDGVPDTYTVTETNKGLLVASSTELVKLSFRRTGLLSDEHIYVSPNTLYFYPHSCIRLIATVVPASGGTASYVGVTTFN